jgi:hypothetical protein
MKADAGLNVLGKEGLKCQQEMEPDPWEWAQ